MIQVHDKAVLLEPIIEEKKKESLNVDLDNGVRKSRVMAIGDEVRKFSVGDFVLIWEGSGTEININDKSHKLIHEEYILKKLNN